VTGEKSRSGTQAITRAALLLRLMAQRGRDGCRLADLGKSAGLPHPTVRRILKCLIEERLAVQNATTRRYQLGPLNYEFGLATMQRSAFKQILRPKLERLAQRSGDTVYLNVRSGAEAVCLDRVEGTSPIRAVTQEIGGRRPLSFGSSGLAMMACLDDREVDEIIEANGRDIANHGRLTADQIRLAVARTRANGFAVIRETTVRGVSAIGIVLKAQREWPTLGVSLAMVNDRLDAARACELYDIMKAELDR
jgi:DNA-binding IclR family transcriptional regulator